VNAGGGREKKGEKSKLKVVTSPAEERGKGEGYEAEKKPEGLANLSGRRGKKKEGGGKKKRSSDDKEKGTARIGFP